MQEARGTSIEPHGEDPTAPVERTPESRRWPIWSLFAVIAVAMWGVDQYTKRLAVEHLAGAEDKSLIGEILQLRLTYNPGAAFSLGEGFTVAITCLAMVATVVVVVMSLKVRSKIWALALGLLLAGIDGNLTDRLLRDPQAFHGHVVDFLMLPNWPIFNVADICINVGAALILIQVLRGVGLDGSRHHDATEQDEAAA